MFVVTRGDRDCLSFYFMGRYLWAHEEIVLASLFCFLIDICRHMRISCLPFFSDLVNICSMTLMSYCSLLAHVTGVSTLLQRFGWDYQYRYFLVLVSYRYTVSTWSLRWWIICLAYTQNLSCVVFLLNFGLASLLFLMNDGSDKPSKYWHSLCVVGIT